MKRYALLVFLITLVAGATYLQQKIAPPTNVTATIASDQLTITGPSVVNNGIVRTPWSIQWTASGGTLPYKWSILDGYQLPAPLQLNANTGVVSGIPQAAGGPYWFGIKVTDATGKTATGGINDCYPFYFFYPLVITTDFTKIRLVATVYNGYQLQAVGYTGYYKWRLYSGSLPPNMTLSESGVFQGFPPMGSWTFQVAVESPGPSQPRVGCDTLFARVRHVVRHEPKLQAKTFAASETVVSFK